MAVTCRDIVRRALRKLSVIASGEEPSGNDANDALETLKALYMELLGMGVFGRMNDVVVTDATYTASQQDRVLCKNETGVTVSLPECASADISCNPNPSSRWTVQSTSLGGGFWGPLTGPTNRPPRDGSAIVITDFYSDLSQSWIYDGQIGRWLRLEGLALSDTAPLAARYSEALACILASRIAPEYGAEASQQVAVGAVRGIYAITHRYDRASEPVSTEYF